jgi:hypothetical protein
VSLVLLAAPLLAIGFAAGALRALSRAPTLSAPRRRAAAAAWVFVLLTGVPAWLVLAAVLRLW